MAEPARTAPSRRIFRYDDNVEISYESEGEGPVPVIFLHGFAAGLITWHDIRSFFPASHYRLFLLDLKGFGFSAKPRDGRYAPEDQAATVVSFMEGLDLRHAVLVGHSLGGGIALLVYQLAQEKDRRELIDRLVLIDCAAYPQRLPRIMRWLRIPPLGWAILNLCTVRFMVRYSLRRIFHDENAITPERTARYITCFGRKGIAYVFTETCRRLVPARYASYSALYRSIAVPTLIIWGEKDRFVDLSLGRRLRDDIPGSRLVVINECGHNPHEERPVETFAAIAEFLGDPRNRELH